MSTPNEQRGRLAQLWKDAAALELDAALVSALPNVRYLTGFTGSNALLLVTERQATLFTDPRYTLQARTESAGRGVKVVIAKKSLEDALTPRLAKLKRIGFENNRLSYRAWEHLQRNLPLSASLRAARAGIGGGEKRCHLERQYAIDLDGYCRIIGQRQPLSQPPVCTVSQG